MVAAHAHELAAVIVEPLVQGAAGMLLADPDGLRALGTRVPRARRAPHLRRGRHRVRPHRHPVRLGAVRPATRPARPGQGPHRRLPADVGDRGPGGRCSTPSSAPTSPSARCTTGTRTRGTRWRPRWRSGTSSCSTRGRCSATSAPAPTSCARCSTTASPRIPRSREVRLCGLMGGVELAPPHEGLRWGRRVCAAAVDRGVLLRPLGDVVVLMPPLTVTSAELHRIVHALDRGARRGRRMTTGADGGSDWSDWADGEAARHRGRRSVAGPPRVRPVGPARAGVVRVQRLPRAHPAPRGARRRARGHRPLGHRCRRGTPHRRLPTGARRARGRAGGLEGDRRRGPLQHRLRRQPRGARHLRRPRHPRVLRRAQPRLDHRRAPARRARRSPSTATATPPTSTSCCAPAPPRAPSS